MSQPHSNIEAACRSCQKSKAKSVSTWEPSLVIEWKHKKPCEKCGYHEANILLAGYLLHELKNIALTRDERIGVVSDLLNAFGLKVSDLKKH